MPEGIIELKGGLLVRADAIALLLDLERRGHVCTAKDGVLRVSRGTRLTPADHAEITRLRGFLLALAAYVPPPGHPADARPSDGADPSDCPTCGRDACEDESHWLPADALPEQ